MGREFIASIVTVLTAVIGLAIVATLVSKNAQTGSVVTSSGQAFSGILSAAEAPVSGSGNSLLSGMGISNFE